MQLDVKDCDIPWNGIYMHVNGDIKPCCYALGRLGRISDGDTVADVIGGSKLAELRQAISDNVVHPVCAGAGCAFVRGRYPTHELGDFAAEIDRDTLGLQLDGGLIARAAFGHPGAMLEVGFKLWDASRYAEAIEWYRRANERGEVIATHMLGTIHRHGWSLPAPDAGLARLYLMAAASRDYAPSISELAEMALAGEGFDADVETAVAQFKEAGKKGDRTAWKRLADLVRDGSIPDANPQATAARYDSLAAGRAAAA